MTWIIVANWSKKALDGWTNPKTKKRIFKNYTKNVDLGGKVDIMGLHLIIFGKHIPNPTSPPHSTHMHLLRKIIKSVKKNDINFDLFILSCVAF